jgi:hypothetical protein
MATPDKAPRIKTRAGKEFVLNARPDTVDFRDRMYLATLVNVPTARDLGAWQAAGVEVRDQGREGSCTGYALAAVADYLLRTRQPATSAAAVSAHMLYAMARRYDEWPGEDYSGSSARGAMKGWFQHGVCSDRSWPEPGGVLTTARRRDALDRPLGAYFRVDHSDLVAMHAALIEVGALYATALVHDGWRNPGPDGLIKPDAQPIGGHAFAIVGFDRDGFWLQNSWGEDWGLGGFAKMSYADWLRNGTDAWVARLGVPLALDATVGAKSTASYSVAHSTTELESAELRPHIISLGNEGKLQQAGTYANTLADLQQIMASDFPRLTQGWAAPHLMIFAHGGLNDEASAVERTRQYCDLFLPRGIYPLCVIWHTDLLSTMQGLLATGIQQRRPEGFLDASKDFLLDRIDDTLEPVARVGGLPIWGKIKANAVLASAEGGGLSQLIPLLPAGVPLHLVGHSAGGNLQAAFARALAASGRMIDTCTLWAPGCTMDAFDQDLLPLVKSEAIRHFALYTLTDKAEQDDSCGFYNKSILYLVSDALEAIPHVPWVSEGEPLLGMAKYASRLKNFFAAGRAEWVQAPNSASGTRDASTAKHHANFDDDPDTLESTIARILGTKAQKPARPVAPLATRARRDRRRRIMERMEWGEPARPSLGEPG